MEEDTALPRRNDTLLLGGMRATRSTSMRFTEPQGRTEDPPVPPRRSTRSSMPPPYSARYSAYGFIILSEEEEKKLSPLEKRLVANVDFNDQALNALGFRTDIYYMLGHLGWVQFSNGVSANTHKEFALEILMTIAPILDLGMQSLSFRLEGIQQVVPYEYVRELLGFQKGAPEKVDVPDGLLDGFWNLISGEAHQQRNSIRNPIIQPLLDVQEDYGEDEGDEGDRHGVELALLGFNFQTANSPLIPYGQPMVLRGNIGIRRYWFGVLPLYVGNLLKAGDYEESQTSFTWNPSRY
jgi:hypothetical protein